MSVPTDEVVGLLSYAHGADDRPLLGQTIGANLDETVRRAGSRPALVSCQQGRRYSYDELGEAVDEVARALIAAGLSRGDRLGLWSPNRAEWVLLQFATAKVGVVLVTLNPAYRTEELRFALNHSGCRLLVAAPAFRGADYRAMVEEVERDCPSLIRNIFLDSEDWDGLLQDAWTVTHETLTARQALTHFDEPINIQYTSGTTGLPKGVTLSHHSILNNAWFTGETCSYGQEDRVCIPVPFYHCFGMVLGNLACTSHGACIVIPGEVFDAAQTLQAVDGENCTSLYGVPTMFIAELELPSFEDYDLSSLRTGIMAGAPCPVEVMRRVIDRMHMEAVTICYGMTETSPVSTQTSATDLLERRVSTVGRVHPHVEVKIVDPGSGALLVPRGETGELCTRGYNVMLGYWDDAVRTAEAIDSARWMHTGDLAIMDEAGYVSIAGRIKDLIIRGGENVSPREIEEFLYAHPAVAEVHVIGVPDDRLGEEIMAWVRLREGAVATGDELRQWCDGRIARFKIPRYWKHVDEFPTTVTGKIQKFKMREDALREFELAGAKR